MNVAEMYKNRKENLQAIPAVEIELIFKLEILLLETTPKII